MKKILEKWLKKLLGLVQETAKNEPLKKIPNKKPKNKAIFNQYAVTYDFLNRALSENASRRGTSAFRLGFIPQGPSDHLPIVATTKTAKNTPLSLVSWNLLADSHLYNNFMNVSGTKEFFRAIQKSEESSDNIYCAGGTEKQNKLYHYFSELAKFLYENQANGVINIDAKRLDEFSDIALFDKYPSHLARSRTPAIAEENKMKVMNARKKMSKILLDPLHPEHHEFRLAIQHSIELYHHIEHGALKWKNRFPLIQKNQALIAQLQQADFVCFQECTSPDDFKAINLPQTFITHRINQTTNDNCVLAYDDKKFELMNTVKGALGGHKDSQGKMSPGNKPFIFGRFKHRETGEEMIMGSVHYPGGEHHCVPEILESIESLKRFSDEKIDFFVAGDYNHTQEFFEGNGYKMHYPQLGTMAGSDYENMNNAIDAVLVGSENTCDRLHVERVSHLAMSEPAEALPLKVHFSQDSQLSEQASPSFWRPVQREVTRTPTLATSAVEEIFARSEANFSPRPSL